MRSARSSAIEITAAGTDADTVMPANMPRYAFAPARITDSSDPRMMTPRVSSGSVLVAGMYGSTLSACRDSRNRTRPTQAIARLCEYVRTKPGVVRCITS